MNRYCTCLIGMVMCLALTTSASAETVEETYAKLCSDGVRSETCDVLRKALVEKLTAVPGTVEGVISPVGAEVADARLVRWGVLGKEASARTQLLISETMSPDKTFSNYVFGAMLLEYEWVSETELKKKTSQLEATSFSWGYGAKGQPSPSPAQYLVTIEETLTLNEAQAKIDVVHRTVAGLGAGSETRSQLDIVPLENYGQPSYMEFAVGADQHYMEVAYEGDNRQVVTGKLSNSLKRPTSYVRVLATGHLSRDQINSIVASEKRKFHSTISAFHQKDPKGDGWLKALIGAGVGLAVGEAYGLDSTQTVGAMMKGIEITGEGSPATTAAGAVGDQLTGGLSSASAQPSGPMTSGAGRGSYPTKSNLAAGTCSGFTEANYRTKALEGGADSQLYTMCGQAFEYYVMYKRAIAQGYSEQDANRTYAAHEQSARVASGYLQSHGAR